MGRCSPVVFPFFCLVAVVVVNDEAVGEDADCSTGAFERTRVYTSLYIMMSYIYKERHGVFRSDARHTQFVKEVTHTSYHSKLRHINITINDHIFTSTSASTCTHLHLLCVRVVPGRRVWAFRVGQPPLPCRLSWVTVPRLNRRRRSRYQRGSKRTQRYLRVNKWIVQQHLHHMKPSGIEP